MNKFFKKFMLRIFYIFLIFIIFQSCDQKSIAFSPPDEDGLSFNNSSFPISVENSTFTMTPSYINQDLGPLLYVGNLPYAESSYSLFQINSTILKDFDLCENDENDNFDMKNRGDIEFRIVGDNLVGDYSALSAYYYQGEVDFIEDNFANYDSNQIAQIVDGIKNHQQQLSSRIDDDIYTGVVYFPLVDIDECTFKDNEKDCLDNVYDEQCTWDNLECFNSEFDVDSFLDWDDFCSQDQIHFYILLEYPDTGQEEYYSIYSSHIPESEPESVNVPSLMVHYERDIEQNNFKNRFDIDELIVSGLLSIDDILYTSDDYSSDFDCSNNEQENCDVYEYCQWNSEIEECLWVEEFSSYDNVIFMNNDETSNALGNIYGIPVNSSNNPIYTYNVNEESTFDIDIKLDDTVQSDSLIFYLVVNEFVYQNQNSNNQIYDSGENLYDTGIDGCPNELETGDILVDNNPCEAPYTLDDSYGCYFDYNQDEKYSLCSDSSESASYRFNGSENNNQFDFQDSDENGSFQENENSEVWKDLGFDGFDDDYETGCRDAAYIYGIGYNGNEDETYTKLIENALEEGKIDSEDFYSFSYNLSDGSSVLICGPQFWNDPQEEGVSGCSVCNPDDPNGDNKNIDPSNDDWEDIYGNIIGDYDESNDWNFTDSDQDGIIDINEVFEPLEGNGVWNWIDDNESGFFEKDQDRHEPFLDFGIDQVENFSSDLEDLTENNGMYDLGEQFFDTGIDGVFTGYETGYCRDCRQGNSLQDSNDSFSEYRDYGFDDCLNKDETGNLENPCYCQNEDKDAENYCENLVATNVSELDLNRDDYNIDPNRDDYSLDNPNGTEDNGLYDCVNEYQCEALDEQVTFQASPSNFLVELGTNTYNYGLDGISVYDKPSTVSGFEKIILWISKIEPKDQEGEYTVTVSMSSIVNIESFQFQLYHSLSSNIDLVSELHFKHLTPFIYNDINGDDNYDTSINNESFIEDSEKYIKDISLYSMGPLNYDENDRLISYGLGMQANLYFDGLANFLSDYDETAYISEAQTYLVIYFDQDLGLLNNNDIYLKVSGSIGSVLIDDLVFPNPIKIENNMERAIIGVGPLIDELLLVSDILDSNNQYITLSIDSYDNAENNTNQLYPIDGSNDFSIVKLSNDKNPHIDIFYAE